VQFKCVRSYLKGSALDCFKPAILEPIEPQWLSDFNLFVDELKANFSSYDPVGKAEAEIEQLFMQEYHQVMKYFIKFQQLATHVEWGKAALSTGLQWTGQTCQEQYGPPLEAEHSLKTPKNHPSY